jgi:hypothetical protein
MNNAGQKNVVGGICRPGSSRRSAAKAEAWLVGGVLATKMPLLAELGNGAQFLKQF